MSDESLRDICADFEGKSVVVTGGAGSIGRRLAAVLSSCAEVTVLDDLSSSSSYAPSDGIRFVNGSILETKSLREAMRSNPDYVFHLAALFANQNSVEHPEQDLLVNSQGTLRVVDIALEYGVEALVYASSSCAYGGQGGVLSESQAPGELETPYAISKFTGELYLKYFASADDRSRLAAIRYFNVYGPGELPGPYRNVIPKFARLAMLGEPLTITGTGEETRDFTYIDDAVAGTLLAALRGKHGSVYNIGTGQETEIRRLIEMILKICDSQSEVIIGRRRSWDSTSARCADISLARSVLGYSPSTSMEDGLKATLAWLDGRITQSGNDTSNLP
ncbi:MAG: NAD-dependent epimerase/dehydratase family protein [Acidimicrobiia bacterium]|nr:NAD-dependent epimerase/dehydratase family protein [Acidimicrobiia bacterium]